MPRTIECFYPGRSFPSISVTGKSCDLNCKHCSKKYLEGMIPASIPADLLEIAEALAERGAKGFLLSGGADRSGRVRMADYVPAIEEIKSTTDLRINAHVGLTPTKELERLVRSGIDSFSVDVYGSDDTIREVLGLSAKADDYFEVVETLMKLGAPIVAPHICIGIHGGVVRGEFTAIERLVSLEPKVLIFISLIPTKGTAYAGLPPPSSGAVISVVTKARKELPNTKLLLGCMRSKLDRSSEHEIVLAGLDGIVLPVAATVERLRAEGYQIRKRATCCSLL